ncbi:MAG: hypothetical protein KAG14_02600, partial [Mycoplasmataceae bacterium]|nr:hypothetical protein [Mycoplasmataceae bacterium]
NGIIRKLNSIIRKKSIIRKIKRSTITKIMDTLHFLIYSLIEYHPLKDGIPDNNWGQNQCQ